MSTAATIRPLIDGDLERVLAVNEANIPAVGAVDIDRMTFLAGESEIALVAEVDDGASPTIAGFCLVLGQGSSYDSENYRWFMDRYTDAFYLDRVAFDHAFQGMGLGTALYTEVDRLIDHRRAAGEHIARLTLEVNIDPPNVPSLTFHARRGFVEVARRPTPYGIDVSMQHKVYA